MVPYQINLARGRVLPLSARRRWRGWFAVYFIVMLVILGVSVALLTRTRIVLANQEERIVANEQRMQATWPGHVDVLDRIRRLNADMANCESQMAGLDAFRKGECQAGRVLLGLVNVMPLGMMLGPISIDAESAKLGYDVYLPANRKDEASMTSRNVITLWSSEPMLKGLASQITAGKSERIKVGGQDMLSLRFAGMLGEGK